MSKTSISHKRICADGSSMLEGVDLSMSDAPVGGTISLCIIIYIATTEGLTIFVINISNNFHNTILSNTEERVYLSLPHIYLELSKSKCPKHPLATRNQKEL